MDEVKRSDGWWHFACGDVFSEPTHSQNGHCFSFLPLPLIIRGFCGVAGFQKVQNVKEMSQEVFNNVANFPLLMYNENASNKVEFLWEFDIFVKLNKS